MFVLIKKAKLKLSDSYSLRFSLWKNERKEGIPKREYVSKLGRIHQRINGTFSPYLKNEFLIKCEQLLNELQSSKKEKRKIWNKIYSYIPPLTKKEKQAIRRWRDSGIFVPM